MGCGIAIIKYLVFIFNLVFAIIGMALLVVGVIFQLSFTKFTDSFDGAFHIAPMFLIIVGGLIFIISFFGCCGAIKESNCMLITYGVLLVLILLLQIGIGIFALMIIRDGVDVRHEVDTEIQEKFSKYNATTNDKEIFDSIQQDLKCCGVTSVADWGDEIPPSCCSDKSSTCGLSSETRYHSGCTEAAYQKVMLVLRSVQYVAFGICACEMIGILFAFCLSNSMKNQYRRGNFA